MPVFTEEERQALSERGGIGLHFAARADDSLSAVYTALNSIKSDMDRMEEVPGNLKRLYDEVVKAISAVANAQKHTHQVRMMARNLKF